jgi:hypothetical protein
MPAAGAACRCRGDGDGILQHFSRQAGDLRRHRRREEQRLAFARDAAEDALDVGEKPHVEHAVGFVEDEMLDPIELRVRPAQMIEQPPGVATMTSTPRRTPAPAAHAHAAVHSSAETRVCLASP